MFKKTISVLLTALLLSTPVLAYAGEVYHTPGNSSFKSFMSFRNITNVTSQQYKLQQSAYTDSNGLRRYEDRYMIAVGSAFYTKPGTYLDVTLSTGVTLPCVVGDIKQDCHTGPDNMQVVGNGNIIEFITDPGALPWKVRHLGDVSAIPGFEGDVVSVYKYSDTEPVDNYDVTIEDEGVTYIVLDKYTIDTEDGVVYIIEYASDSVFNLREVTEEEYSNLTPGVSIVYD